MKSDRKMPVRQVLSATAVVLSLVFVGTEIRQNTKAIRAQTRQALADGSRELIIEISAAADVYSGVFQSLGAPSDSALTLADTLQARWLMLAHLRNVENVWHQWQQGVVSQDVLDSYSFRSGEYRTAAFQEMWYRIGVQRAFDPDFVRAFKEANELR